MQDFQNTPKNNINNVISTLKTKLLDSYNYMKTNKPRFKVNGNARVWLIKTIPPTVKPQLEYFMKLEALAP